MEDFFPENLQGWLVVIGGVLAILGYMSNRFSVMLKLYVNDPMDRLTNKLDKLESNIDVRIDGHQAKLNKHDEILAQHDKALELLEAKND